MQSSDLLLDGYGRIRELVHRSAAGLDGEGLAFRPEEGANSIAWLLWHLTRTQDDHISEIAGRQQVWGNGIWAERLGLPADPDDTGYGHGPEQVAAVRPDHSEAILGYYDAVAARTDEYLRSVTADELDRVIDRSYNPPIVVGVRLVSVLDDNLQHAGQACYLRGIIDRQRSGRATPVIG